jgi:ubiquinol-cytochrome c reductase cytochrome b subunit
MAMSYLGLYYYTCNPIIQPNVLGAKRIGPHNLDVISLLVGALLGDAGAERLMNGGVRFRFKQAHKDYLLFLYHSLQSRGYCNTTLPTLKVSEGLGYYLFNTYSFTSLLWLYDSFYNDLKVKVIPLNIKDLLTPLALAVWIQDDGGRHGNGLRLHTHCFTRQEVELLMDALTQNFNF